MKLELKQIRVKLDEVEAQNDSMYKLLSDRNVRIGSLENQVVGHRNALQREIGERAELELINGFLQQQVAVLQSGLEAIAECNDNEAPKNIADETLSAFAEMRQTG